MAFNQDGSTITAQCPLQKNRRRSEKDISITKITSGDTQKEDTTSCKLKQESLAQIKKQKQNEGLK